MIDSTDVAANVSYPSKKKLVIKAFNNIITELSKFNKKLAIKESEKFQIEIDYEYKINMQIRSKVYFEIAKEHMNYLYLKTYDKLQKTNKYQEAYNICWNLINQYLNNTKDKIISIVDVDARVAHKSPGNMKKGYKDHILVDEESEIIIASIQTPFNIGDEKILKALIQKSENEIGLKPKELSADKVYGKTENRAFLKDNDIISNILFPKESSRKVNCFGIKDFKISENMDYAICPNKIKTEKFSNYHEKRNNQDFIIFKFSRNECDKCKLRDKCLHKNKNRKLIEKARKLRVSVRYDAILKDRKRIETEEFKKAINNRFIVERRFATLVRNHGLRRCRYIRLPGAKIHITMANIACNVIRMVNLLCQPRITTA
jgi:hypothetical protein